MHIVITFFELVLKTCKICPRVDKIYIRDQTLKPETYAHL